MDLSLDIRTLLSALTVASSCLAVAMVFFSFTQKTYDGFRDWTKGTVLLALGYMLFMLRGVIPDLLSVLGANLTFTAGATYLVVGTRRFLGLTPQRHLLWFVPTLSLIWLGFFYWVHPSPSWRGLVVALACLLMGAYAAGLLLLHSPERRRLLYMGTGLMLALLGLSGLARAVILMVIAPEHKLLASNWALAGYFMAALIAQLFWTVGFLLMNSERLRNDLNQSRSQLAALVENQRKILDFLPDPTWVVDSQGRVSHWNQAMERLTGVPAARVLGKGDYEHALPLYGERRPCLIDLMLKHDPEWEGRYQNLEHRGNTLATSEFFMSELGEAGLYVAASATCLLDDQGQVSGAIETLRDVSEAKRNQQEREKLIDELTAALAKVQTLKGLIPICSHCKSIRRDEGYWEQLETFFSEHAEVEFSHGICPDCLEKYYREFKNSPSKLDHPEG
ncbi:MAG: PAS domain-containing protein [Desulfarculus sp.]|nr:PAS domain-containing protein [Pseudomonadota bacterium]MBV1715019.1 PAS domain-containing protein [Desulfarculus sp.]MBU4573468.1 PAS domain-containing protein [Pseudomonadota bacterium]MBU4599708.1 PAS domain-containing protein [Pseudomonadota bacterium]MBV1739937.1 PAS domain-containing protein [Desulfarculus sp.]